ncbi:hypothetical protein MAC_07828 [Metarhizium acridum CQMa 102]|uniref:Protein kinase domain-containing protein n=1 Tax=Metarhizium acridum (strain CQMa 102) TaxID=655827 RepID=E9ED80_METAQ|nr:uncharacterized protein MAC_07828 [Metarhizium acridum CQMa 102]EFY86163.1 hypothetical protein MAC_07828 [Metarhizium acridum CQMa 102]
MQIINSFEAGKRINGKIHIYVKVIVQQDGSYYMGKWDHRKHLPAEFSQLQDVKLIPTKDRGPVPKPTWTIAHPQSDTFSKTPALEDYLDPELKARTEHEIEVCERLRQHPHPNLALYHGCLITQGRVSGLIFNKYECNLLEKVNP